MPRNVLLNKSFCMKYQLYKYLKSLTVIISSVASKERADDPKSSIKYLVKRLKLFYIMLFMLFVKYFVLFSKVLECNIFCYRNFYFEIVHLFYIYSKEFYFGLLGIIEFSDIINVTNSEMISL
jgi:hypothetical protein